MQTSIQYSGLYTFIDILGARDGAGVGSFHHYVPILCITADAHHLRGWCQKYSFGHQSWEVDYDL